MIRRVAVGSENPVKVAAVREALGRLGRPDVEVQGWSVDSGVADQPWGRAETIRGALARARAALVRDPEAEVGIGLEGGVEEIDGQVYSIAWCAAVDREGRVGVGGGMAFPLPPRVVAGLRQGWELGTAMDALTGETDTKRRQGAIGILSGGALDRREAYSHLVIYALLPLLNPDLYEG